MNYSAGGGAIKVVMTGDQHCQSVEIDPELLKDSDVEMLQDLVLAAVNGALDASRAPGFGEIGTVGRRVALLTDGWDER